MFDKSPIGSVVVHKVSVLNPDSIFVAKKGGSSKNLKLLQHFVKIKALIASHADKASIQYEEFKNDIKLVNKDDDMDCLDILFHKVGCWKEISRTPQSYYYHSHS